MPIRHIEFSNMTKWGMNSFARHFKQWGKYLTPDKYLHSKNKKKANLSIQSWKFDNKRATESNMHNWTNLTWHKDQVNTNYKLHHMLPCCVWWSCVLISSTCLVIHSALSSHSVSWALSWAHRSTCREREREKKLQFTVLQSFVFVPEAQKHFSSYVTIGKNVGHIVSHSLPSNLVEHDWPHSEAAFAAPVSGFQTLPRPAYERSAVGEALSVRPVLP